MIFYVIYDIICEFIFIATILYIIPYIYHRPSVLTVTAYAAVPLQQPIFTRHSSLLKATMAAMTLT
jgi:hypothetical protein